MIDRAAVPGQAADVALEVAPAHHVENDVDSRPPVSSSTTALKSSSR